MRRPSAMPWVLAAVPALALMACASTGTDLRPGTGDISFRLTWEGTTDLDLYVVSPTRERIDFARRSSSSGGRLDIDCNVQGRMCPEPMENIFWPRGQAPFGNYMYWAVMANAEGLKATDSYRLEVRHKKKIQRAHEGLVSSILDNPSVSAVELQPGGEVIEGTVGPKAKREED